MVSLGELLSQSDFISVHAPLTPATRKMFGREQFRQMKPTAYLINTSRGGLIDEAALEEAIKSDCIAGAALDVFDPEPCDLSRPLFQDERVIVTPMRLLFLNSRWNKCDGKLWNRSFRYFVEKSQEIWSI